MKPILLGACSSFFFAFTFILNSSMEMNGGSWIWSSSLRYYFMVVFLLLIVGARKNLKAVFAELKQSPVEWLLWSTVGFGLFYAPLTYASSFAPGWLIASTWQITIVCGPLLAPLFTEKVLQSDGTWLSRRGQIPWKGLLFSSLILLGIIVMQIENATFMPLQSFLLCTLSLLIAAFCYPLGNRKMMGICNNRLDSFQRVLGMTIASLPFWLILSVYGLFTVGAPSSGQVIQSGLVALLSGVCATVLFFAATDLVKDNMEQLGSVEATQSLQIPFVVVGELLFLSSGVPSLISCIGMLFVMLGMILHSYMSRKANALIAEKNIRIEKALK